MIDGRALEEGLCTLARQAGEAAMTIRNGFDLGLETKTDGSPVTRADHASQKIIVDGLKNLTPDIPIIAEEQADSNAPHPYATYWLVDPLDGTRDFITGHNDFSINIGLIVDSKPHTGVVFAPARNDMVFGTPGYALRIKNGHKEYIDPTRTSPIPPRAPVRLVISVRDAKRNPTELWLQEKVISSCMIHASAYKILLVAVGEADIFLRTGITSEWDTAAGDAVLRALGGRLVTPDGKDLTYNKPGLTNGTLIGVAAHFDDDRLKDFFDLL